MAKLRSNLTIIIPVFNAATTLPILFNTLEQQKFKHLVDQIIFIEDCSTDDSHSQIQRYSKKSSYSVKVIRHRRNLGLASSYNQGLCIAKTKFFVLMHADIILTQDNTFNLIIQPFHLQPRLLCTYPQSRFPMAVYNRYNFWQKAMFCRHVGKETSYFCGKFDCYNRRLFIKQIGLFNEKDFRTAGEDGDIIQRIRISKLASSCSSVAVIHLHSQDPNFGWLNVVKKEAQYAEAQGALLRRYKPDNPLYFILVFFRPLLLFGLFFPYLNIPSLFLIVAYSFLYTRLLFQTEYRHPRILLLPSFNILLLFVSTYYSIKGFTYGCQKL